MMINRLIDWSLKNPFLVLVLTGLLVLVGVASLKKLPIDAVPDITNVQVQILTQAPALSPLEIEKFITFPVEAAMSGLPDVEEIRSVSKFGLSSVTVVFKEHVDIYFARRLVMERLDQAKEMIPQGFGTPEMGPISTGLGEIYQFEVRGEKYSSMELRSILDWFIAYQLRSVPGVVEVNTFGGELKTYEVQVHPERLIAFQIPMGRVFEALEENNANAGGAYLVHNNEQYLIRGEGLVENLEQIGNIVVETKEGGTPVKIQDLAEVKLAPMVRQGAVTRDGRGEIVSGIVMMLIGENSRVVVNRVKEKIEEIKKSLPEGVTIEPFYDRTDLVRKTIRTVSKNLIEGGILVIAVLLLILGNLRGGLIVASAIPLSMLFAFAGMVLAGISGNLMSLGAIDFGLIVDGSVVMIENILRHLSQKKGESFLHTVRGAALEVGRPIVFAVGIIIIVYVPILSLMGIEGKMFRPMAATVIFALAGSLILALVLMPVLGALFFRKELKEGAHAETRLMQWVHRRYEPLLTWAVSHRAWTVGIAAGSFLLSLAFVPFMGAVFIPRLDEGALAIQAWRLPSVALEESVKQSLLIEKTLKSFPEVETVVSKTGRAEIATDPMGVEISDILVMLKPPDQWTSAEGKEELIEKIDTALDENVPGAVFSYSQPIELRVSELIAGVRSDVAIKLYGEEMEILRDKAHQIARVVSEVEGARDVKVEQVSGLPFLRIKINRDHLARYGVNASEVLDVVRSLGGKPAGEVFEGQRRFALQVRFSEEDRKDVEAIKHIKLLAENGTYVSLEELADFVTEEGPAQISRENIQRRITVEANVRGRDIASFVSDAKKAIHKKVKIPAGYWLEWGGQFRNLASAAKRLMVVVPISLFIIFVLLYTTFGSTKMALLIYANVPLAVTGGIFALFVRGLPFSISAGVGFIALFGIAVLNGVVLVSYILKMTDEGMYPIQAAMEGAKVRLRPVLMTALVAAFGFVPMAVSTGAGAEVQRPLATVVIGGLVTSTLLTLFVLPTLYGWVVRNSKEG